jgi:hypothetical protein
VVRAVLEGVACSLREALDVMTPLARPERLLATGGGAASDVWLQILADARPAARAPVDADGAPLEVGAGRGRGLARLAGAGAPGAERAADRTPTSGSSPIPRAREASEARRRATHARASAYPVEALLHADVAVEINTSGVRKCGEPFPAWGLIERLHEAGVPLTFGSDAHTPDEVHFDFDAIRRGLLERGIDTLIVLRQRVRCSVPIGGAPP